LKSEASIIGAIKVVMEKYMTVEDREDAEDIFN